VRFSIRVKPGASRTRVGGDHDGALVISVGQRAVDGRATEAALRALADAMAVRRRDVILITGAASRTKVVQIEADPEVEATLLLRLAGLRCEPAGGRHD
jgi:uncharacterized protein YggU (UPF0235/DUF167 family)